jgi:hypothetical protein
MFHGMWTILGGIYLLVKINNFAEKSGFIAKLSPSSSSSWAEFSFIFDFPHHISTATTYHISTATTYNIFAATAYHISTATTPGKVLI